MADEVLERAFFRIDQLDEPVCTAEPSCAAERTVRLGARQRLLRLLAITAWRHKKLCARARMPAVPTQSRNPSGEMASDVTIWTSGNSPTICRTWAYPHARNCTRTLERTPARLHSDLLRRIVVDEDGVA